MPGAVVHAVALQGEGVWHARHGDTRTSSCLKADARPPGTSLAGERCPRAQAGPPGFWPPSPAGGGGDGTNSDTGKSAP